MRLMRSSVLVLAFLCAAMVSGYPQGYTVKFATGEWLPYTSESIANQGFFCEIVSAACKESGIVPDYFFAPWRRGEEMTKTGLVFACFPYIKNGDRAASYLFSSPVFRSSGKFFALKGGMATEKLTWKSFSELSSFRIGGVLGYWYEKDFKAAKLAVFYSTTDEANFNLLLKGRIDIAPCDELVGWQVAEKLIGAEAASKLIVVDQALNTDDLRLMVSKTYPESEKILALFNEGLAKIRKNGVYAAILAKYHIKE